MQPATGFVHITAVGGARRMDAIKRLGQPKMVSRLPCKLTLTGRFIEKMKHQ
jgi:hypothetical protein